MSNIKALSSIKILYPLRPISTLHLSVINSSEEKRRKPFFTSMNSVTLTVDLKHKINRGQVLLKTNKHVNYESFVINIYQDNEGKSINPFDLDLLPNYLNVNRCHLFLETNKHVKCNSFVINSS